MEGSDTYLIRPNHQYKFKPAIVKQCIREIVRERLSGMQYDPEEVPELSRSLAECIKDKVKNAGFDRYKLVVQVVIGEQRGQGVKMSSRSLWDADTDNYAEDVFMNVGAFALFIQMLGGKNRLLNTIF
ncbi:tctex1 domain-containing protein 2 isoform X1 [Cyclopterus lumpus]|uniref:tctex1 domain-containing protein 2 isoform X1 n=1 Tax=Cyclopterus lumpus TaxID=8103 RepID=UPI00148760F6|nr:tctex1 domain-containing protein 2 isoform X1 [Cyclopterus lumpus]